MPYFHLKFRFITQFSYSNYTIKLVYPSTATLEYMRKWADEATKTAVWEVYKFIHVNTVAPFGTFRTKIRKWKKIVL